MATENLNSDGVVDEIVVPQIGMRFVDIHEAWEFYKSFAKQSGFPVKKRSSAKNVLGEVRSYTFTCAREGVNKSSSDKILNPQASIRCGCLAKLVVRLDQCVGWVVSNIVLENTHEVTPENARYFRCNRYVNPHVMNQINLLDQSGVRLNKSYSSLVNEVGGHENMTCTEKDCRNMVDKLRRLRLGEGDAAAIVKYFAQKVSENSGFYFAMDLDDEGHLRNVFWADGRAREAFKEFGEVISFDTTYLVNKYDMPFAPFVGVNHHGQSTLFGSGLVAHEDTESFVWLFSKWLDCMSGYAPPAIITDQDKAMKAAIEIVFPTSRHRWCLWHVMKKLPEKFKAHRDYERIVYKMKKVVYNTQYPLEFETKWEEFLERYGLHDNEWLMGLYEERSRWIPCYLNDTFWAGMSSTQRSESMNSFFDGYLTSRTSLKQFVEQYEVALRDKVEKERKADSDSRSKNIPTVTKFRMEKQIQNLYTLSKYKEFQAELVAKMYCEVVDDETDPAKWVTSELQLGEDFEKTVYFDVTCDVEAQVVSCSCRLFESRGILCRHAINVLIRKGIMMIPERYILRRWRKDVIRLHTSMKVNVTCWVNNVERDRYNKLTIKFSEIADRAAKTEEGFNDTNHMLAMHLEKLKICEETSRSDQISLQTEDCQEHQEDEGVGDLNVLDPLHITRKGRPKTKRLVSQWRSKRNTPTNEGNDGGNVVTTQTKKRGRPVGSKNKKKNQAGFGDGEIQQTQESISSNVVAQPRNYIEPWIHYPQPGNYQMEHNIYHPTPSMQPSQQFMDEIPTSNAWKNMLFAMEAQARSQDQSSTYYPASSSQP